MLQHFPYALKLTNYSDFQRFMLITFLQIGDYCLRIVIIQGLILTD